MTRATKLTPKERELFEALKGNPKGVLRQHIKSSNTVCYRLLDEKLSPLQNYRYGIVARLVDKNILVLSGTDYVLAATSETYK